MGTTLADVARKCSVIIDKLVLHGVEGLEDQRARFRLCCDTLGMFADPNGHASIDYRLRGNLEIRTMVAALLDLLNMNLRYISLADPLMSTDEGTSNMSSPSVSSCETSRSGTSSRSSSPQIDVQLLGRNESFRGVQETITRLTRVAVAIRKSGSTQRNVRADKYKDAGHDMFFSVLPQIIRSKIPKAKPFLQERVVSAIARRRNRFLYWRSHAAHLSRPNPSRAPMVTGFGDTETGESKLEVAQNLEEVDTDARPLMSAPAPTLAATRTTASAIDSKIFQQAALSTKARSISSSRSGWQVSMEGLPMPPKTGPNATHFLCPICFMACPTEISKGKHWRDHISQDFEPYICVFDNCPSGTDLTGSSSDWKAHVTRAHAAFQWVCSAPVHSEALYFDSQEQFATHLSVAHQGSFTITNVSALAQRSKQRAELSLEECPFCEKTLEHVSREEQSTPQDSEDQSILIKHIANHLWNLAKISIPIETGDGTPSDVRSSSTASSSKHSDFKVESHSSSVHNALVDNEGLDLDATESHDDVYYAEFIPDSSLEIDWGDFQARFEYPEKDEVLLNFRLHYKPDSSLPLDLLENFRIGKRTGNDQLGNETWHKVQTVRRRATSVVVLQESTSGKARIVKEYFKGQLRDVLNCKEILITLTRFGEAPFSNHFEAFLGWYEDDSVVAIVTEYFKLGDFEKCISSSFISEHEARIITRQLLSGLEMLHRDGLVHCNVTPTNIFVQQKGPTWRVKIGISTMATRKYTSETLGSRVYQAPEICAYHKDGNNSDDDVDDENDVKIYTTAVDIWSVGIILHEMIAKKKPTTIIYDFKEDLPRYRRAASYSEKQLLARGASSTVIELIRVLVDPIPSNRPDATGALSHIWFASDASPLNQTSTPIFSVPISRNPDYVDRTAISVAVDACLSRNGQVALYGYGGVGKSQIAIDYCYRFRDQHPTSHVVWINAHSRERYTRSFERTARALQLRGWDNPNVDIISIVNSWLSDVTNQEWLLVIDGLDDLEILSSSSPDQEKGENEARGFRRTKPLLASNSAGEGTSWPEAILLPQVGNLHGRVFLTTRQRHVGTMLWGQHSCIQVSGMTTLEAITSLKGPVHQNQLHTDPAAAELVGLLSNMPLAIAQVKSLISKRDLSIPTCVKQLRNKLEMQELLHAKGVTDGTSSISETFRLSLELIKAQNPRAADILSLMSMLDTQSIPSELLRAALEQEIELFPTAISLLHDFSMIGVGTAPKTHGMDRIVQLAVQNWLRMNGEAAKWQKMALKRVSQSFPEPAHNNVPSCENILPHATVVLDYEFHESHVIDWWSRLAYKKVAYDLLQGRDADAKKEIERACKIFKLPDINLSWANFFALTSFSAQLTDAMRFMNTSTYKIHVENDQEFRDSPEYAVLSHRWSVSEITFATLKPGELLDENLQSPELNKLRAACAKARHRNPPLKWLWIDACCMNHSNPSELTRTVDRMFQIFKTATVCYTYLEDVDSLVTLPHSRWFTRAWTLQELLAPDTLEFYSRDWQFIGTKRDLASIIAKPTGIATAFLTGRTKIHEASIATRMSWMARRTAVRIEDVTYSMCGIFDIIMPAQYGEGNQAFMRLQKTLMETSFDESLFAWSIPPGSGLAGQTRGLLAPSPNCFKDSHDIIVIRKKIVGRPHPGCIWTEQGVQFQVSGTVGTEAINMAGLPRKEIFLPLNCWRLDADGTPLTVVLHLVKVGNGYTRDQCDVLTTKKGAKPSSGRVLGVEQRTTRSITVLHGMRDDE